MDEIAFFAPWRLVAAFADGSRLLFDGLTEEQARDAMEAAQEEHGDIGYWNRVTDQNYEDGRYYKTVPPPCINIVDYDGYTGPLDENGLPVGSGRTDCPGKRRGRPGSQRAAYHHQAQRPAG